MRVRSAIRRVGCGRVQYRQRCERGSEQQERVRAALWQELTLRPADASVPTRGDALSGERGDTRGARHLRPCGGSEPELHDVRAQLGLRWIGGCEIGGVRRLPTERVIALTFDDGPKPGITEPLLEMLTNAHVPATFFVIGKHVMEYPELTRRIADAGMEIANQAIRSRT